MTQPLAFKRVLLKMSGEMLAGDQGYGIDPETIQRYAREIQELREASFGAPEDVARAAPHFTRQPHEAARGPSA